MPIDWTQDRRWQVASSSNPSQPRTVFRWGQAGPGEDTWTCSCPGYRYGQHKKAGFRCRHIKAVRDRVIHTFTQHLDNGSIAHHIPR